MPNDDGAKDQICAIFTSPIKFYGGECRNKAKHSRLDDSKFVIKKVNPNDK